MGMLKSYKISDLHEQISKFGIKLSLDQIRKLHKAGIVPSTLSKGGHRWFNEEQFKRAVRNIIYYYFNTPIAEIKSSDESVLKERFKKIMKAARSLA